MPDKCFYKRGQRLCELATFSWTAEYVRNSSRPEELCRVRGAHGLALVHDRRVGVEQRRVADVAVADRPADVAGRPPHIAGAVNKGHIPSWKT